MPGGHCGFSMRVFVVCLTSSNATSEKQNVHIPSVVIDTKKN